MFRRHEPTLKSNGAESLGPLSKISINANSQRLFLSLNHNLKTCTNMALATLVRIATAHMIGQRKKSVCGNFYEVSTPPCHMRPKAPRQNDLRSSLENRILNSNIESSTILFTCRSIQNSHHDFAQRPCFPASRRLRPSDRHRPRPLERIRH